MRTDLFVDNWKEYSFACVKPSPIMKGFPRRKRKIMYDDSIEVAEAITYRTEQHVKRGRLYEKKVAVALWPQEGESAQKAHDGQSQADDEYVQHDMNITDEVPGADSVPIGSPKPRKVRIIAESISGSD